MVAAKDHLTLRDRVLASEPLSAWFLRHFLLQLCRVLSLSLTLDIPSILPLLVTKALQHCHLVDGVLREGRPIYLTHLVALLTLDHL